MNQMEYDTLRRQYAHRRRYAENAGETEENLPYSVSFRIRLIVCIALFLFFLFAEKNILTPEEEEKIYDAMEQNVTVHDWKEYAADVFSFIK